MRIINYMKIKLNNVMYNIITWCIRRLAKNSNIIKHFRYEANILTKSVGDEGMQELMNREVENVLSLISLQGHSGFSIGYMKNMLNKAIDFRPLSKLTFRDDEFVEVCDGWKQNRRDGRIFIRKNGKYSFNDALKYTPNIKIGIDEKSGHVFKEKALGTTWNGTVIAIPKKGDPYAVRDITIKDTSTFNCESFNIGAIEIEYPTGWWLSVCKESDLEEFSNIYDFSKDYNHVEVEVNFQGGKHRKNILKLLSEAKRHLYKAK